MNTRIHQDIVVPSLLKFHCPFSHAMYCTLFSARFTEGVMQVIINNKLLLIGMHVHVSCEFDNPKYSVPDIVCNIFYG